MFHVSLMCQASASQLSIMHYSCFADSYQFIFLKCVSVKNFGFHTLCLYSHYSFLTLSPLNPYFNTWLMLEATGMSFPRLVFTLWFLWLSP